MKKATKLLAIGAALTASLCISAAAVGVTVEGVPVKFTDAVPFVDENNRTQVPLRAVADAMGLEVEWDNEKREAIFSKEWTLETSPSTWDEDGDGVNESYQSFVSASFYPNEACCGIWVQSMVLDLETGEMVPDLGGPLIEMDTAPVLKDGRMYAPIRYLAEQFYMDVQWDSATQTVALSKRIPTSWHYFYSVMEEEKEDNIQLLLAPVANMKSAKFTALNIICLTLEEGEMTSDTIAFNTTAGQEIIDNARAKGDAPLALLTASYSFEKKGSYTLVADFTYTTETGIERESAIYIDFELE